MSPDDDKKTSLALPTASSLDAPANIEPRGGFDAEKEREKQEKANALSAPLPSAVETEAAKRKKAKLDLYYWLRSQRWTQVTRGALEGGVAGGIAQLGKLLVMHWLGPKPPTKGGK